MALLTVGTGTLLLGVGVVGRSAAIAIGVALWRTGTVLGLAASVWIPFATTTRHHHDTAVAAPAWLMPVVPPLVSPSTGLLLIPPVGPGQCGVLPLAGCYAMFGLSLFVGLITMTMAHSPLVHGIACGAGGSDGMDHAGDHPQSITAANLLAATVPIMFADQPSVVARLQVFGIVYGRPAAAGCPSRWPGGASPFRSAPA
jgi:hypothetical protein